MPARENGGRRIRVVVLFVFLVILGIFAFGQFSAYHDLATLRDRGVATTGKVTDLNSLRHNVSYAFVVFGTTYTGSDGVGSGDGNPPFDTLRVGGPINVVFDPSDPRVSVTGNPAFRIVGLETEVGIAAGVIVILGLAAIYAYFFIGGEKGVRVWKR